MTNFGSPGDEARPDKRGSTVVCHVAQEASIIYSQAVKKGAAPKNTKVKKDVIYPKMAAKK